MFRELLGLPAHPLMVHAAVVFVPLLALLAVVYTVVPRWRARTGWAVAILAVLAPVTALIAKLSGEELERVLIDSGYPPEILNEVSRHADLGDITFWLALALALVMATVLLLTSGRLPGVRLPGWFTPVAALVVAALAAVTVYYVFATGDSGAQAVWRGVLP